ncbi:hypothetical protein A2U01_0089397, partial [Trifolium medium]|nr:hypothetical protein [Trifolium medium]
MKAKIGVAIVADSGKGGPGSTEEVRVGDNVIHIGARQETVVNTKAPEQVVVSTSRKLVVYADAGKDKD